MDMPVKKELSVMIFYKKVTENIVLVTRPISHSGTRPPLVTVVQDKASTSGWRLQQVRPHITSLQNHQIKGQRSLSLHFRWRKGRKSLRYLGGKNSPVFPSKKCIKTHQNHQNISPNAKFQIDNTQPFFRWSAFWNPDRSGEVADCSEIRRWNSIL